jgi:hypothetical protein
MHLARCLVDRTLPDVDGRGAAGAAIGCGRRGIGKDEAARHRDRWDVVDGRGRHQRKHDWDGAIGRNVGAPALCIPFQRRARNLPLASSAKLGTDIPVATLIVAEQRLRARRNPFDPSAAATRSPFYAGERVAKATAIAVEIERRLPDQAGAAAPLGGRTLPRLDQPQLQARKGFRAIDPVSKRLPLPPASCC